MKVLWLTNIRLPRIDAVLGNNVSATGGGWLSGLSDELLKDSNIQLTVCYPIFSAEKEENTTQDKQFHFYGISVKKENFEKGTLEVIKYCNEFDRILDVEQPDIIHIHGTEFQLALALVNSTKRANMLDRVVVSIQGLVSVYSKHFFAELPEHIVKDKTFYELVKKNSLIDEYKKYVKRGISEQEVLSSVNNVIGRTCWDKACTKLINPDIVYYECNEILRSVFFEGTWSWDMCEKYTIFLSQGSKPIKGIHKVIETLALVKKRYPNVKLRVSGNKLITDKSKLTNTYAKYVWKMIEQNKLQDNVEFLGILNAEQVRNELLNCQVFVCPSSIENSPNSLGEAMLLGVPCISADVGGVSSMLQHKKEGFLYPFSETYSLAYYIEELFENRRLAEKFSCNAQNKAKKVHDPYINVKRTLEIYKDIISRY